MRYKLDTFNSTSLCQLSYMRDAQDKTRTCNTRIPNILKEGCCMCLNERLTGFGPVIQPWQGRVLPLYYNRTPVFSGETVTHLVHCTLTGLAPVRPASLGVLLLLELSGDVALLRTSYRYAASVSYPNRFFCYPWSDEDKHYFPPLRFSGCY